MKNFYMVTLEFKNKHQLTMGIFISAALLFASLPQGRGAAAAFPPPPPPPPIIYR